MRIFWLFLLLFFIPFALPSQSALDQRITLQERGIRLGELLRRVEASEGVHFSYSSNYISLNQLVSVDVRNQSLRKALDQIFQKTNIEYQLIGNFIVLKASKSSLPTSDTAPRGLPTSLPVQEFQTVRGIVVDADSKVPLTGANIRVVGTPDNTGTSTDVEGRFSMEKIPIGRQTFEVSYLGYKSFLIKDIVIISGKETVLDIELQELATELDAVVVNASIDKMTPLNEMSLVSTRTFTVEETSRYPGSFHDPARMSRSFAGVSTIYDLENRIVIRGNAPTNLLWRLEGIDIPNPNHYDDIGSSGGAISMLSSNTLSNSDFLTGAFPAEYGNTISGVFDLKMRAGNNQKTETSVYAGMLGIGASTEGPLQKGTDASYLINYRYSSLALLDEMGINPVENGGVPHYQDLSFKINLPTPKAGRFAIFGLGGINSISREAVFDNDESINFYNETEKSGLSILGASHFFMISDQSYLKTIVSGAYQNYNFFFERFEGGTFNPVFEEFEDYRKLDMRINTTFNHKFNARNTIRAGLRLSRLFYDLDYQFVNRAGITPRQEIVLDDLGLTGTVQSFFEWKHRFGDDWTILAGMHQLYFGLNNLLSLEPRLAVRKSLRSDQSFSFGFGMHSYTGDPTIYFIRNVFTDEGPLQPFRDINLPKAAHFVAGYDWNINNNLRFKAEAYFQHIYQVPVSTSSGHTWLSFLNIITNYDLLNAELTDIVTEGRGRNFGLELTLEKYFSQKYYYLLTASLFDSRYMTPDGRTFSTRYNGNFVVNLTGGKEWTINRNNLLGINVKLVANGGNRYSVIDEEQSRQLGYTVLVPGLVNSQKAKTYQRVDFSASYSINRPGITHTFQIDIQNLFNRKNVLEFYYDRSTRQIETGFQAGIIPNIYYQVSF